MGHEDAFPPHRPKAGYVIGKETVAWPRQRIVGLTRKRSFAPDFCTRQSPAHANSASSAFASFRSAVSKPSVNQP